MSLYTKIDEVSSDNFDLALVVIRLIPYGIPLSNQKMFVLDSNFKQCPNEVKGEIYIGGLGLASGYYGDKELRLEF